MSKIIAVQGDKASFHDIAAGQYFDSSAERLYCDSFAKTFSAMSEGRADFVLSAIENSLYGSINEVYDLLLKHDFHIVGEVYQRIEQCLIGIPGASIDTISEIYSHPVALAQCEQYIDTNLPKAKRSEYHDTAAGVALVQKLKSPSVAAIASRQAAALYDMQIVAESIESNTENYTRFVVLHTQPTVNPSANKTSLVIKSDHTSGALHAALGCFAKQDISLTKLQSRPIIGTPWQYMFYIDVATGSHTKTFHQAVQEIQSQNCQITILGSYQSGLNDQQ